MILDLLVVGMGGVPGFREVVAGHMGILADCKDAVSTRGIEKSVAECHGFVSRQGGSPMLFDGQDQSLIQSIHTGDDFLLRIFGARGGIEGAHACLGKGFACVPTRLVRLDDIGILIIAKLDSRKGQIASINFFHFVQYVHL